MQCAMHRTWSWLEVVWLMKSGRWVWSKRRAYRETDAKSLYALRHLLVHPFQPPQPPRSFRTPTDFKRWSLH